MKLEVEAVSLFTRIRRRHAPIVLGGLLVLALPLLLANHWSDRNWTDEHRNYPARPSGYAQIVSTFGQPCNAGTHAIKDTWKAWNNGQSYTIWFHRKLGGMDASITRDQDGRSTNLDNDIWGHINARHENNHVKSGIYGYYCRYISGTTKWSTHAWGIAIDVSASFEPVGSNRSNVNYHHADIWERHRWYWGRAFGDPMHFQYADNY